jgi:hypothetical protein
MEETRHQVLVKIKGQGLWDIYWKPESVQGKEGLRKRIPFMEIFLVDNYRIWHRATNIFL